MAKQTKKLDFSEDPRGIRDMLKDIIDLFNCNPLSVVSIDGRTYNAVATFANNFLDLIPSRLPVLCKKFGFQITLSKQTLNQNLGASAFHKELHKLVTG